MYKADNLFSYDRQYNNIEKTIKQEGSDIAFIVITKDENWWPAINEALTLRKIKMSYMIREDGIDYLPDILTDYWQTHSRLLLYRGYDCKITEQDFIQKMNVEFKPKNIQKLDSFMGEIYLLEQF